MPLNCGNDNIIITDTPSSPWIDSFWMAALLVVRGSGSNYLSRDTVTCGLESKWDQEVPCLLRHC